MTSDLLCLTNRALCKEPLFDRLEKLASAKPAGLLLREKDLSEEAYRALAERVLALCAAAGIPCLLHHFPAVARQLGVKALHLSLPRLKALSAADRAFFSTLGASCHSLAEAKEAEALGCTYLIFGHVFETDCKKGLPGRGPAALADICAHVRLPVLAIGGITPENAPAVRAAGASGLCVMSSAMTSPDPAALVKAFSPEKGRRANV